MTDLRESVARAIATSYGLDPDDIAPRSVICGPGNEHLQEWEAYAEQADAALRALAEAGPTDGMVATLSDALLDVGHLVSDSEARAAIAAALKEMGAG